MREIVSIHVGQCGNQLGNRFWDVVAREHGIDDKGTFVGRGDTQLQGLGVYCREGAQGGLVWKGVTEGA